MGYCQSKTAPGKISTRLNGSFPHNLNHASLQKDADANRGRRGGGLSIPKMQSNE